MSQKKPSDQEIVAQFNGMKQELQAIAQKVGELEMETEEHKLVIDTISPLDPERKCFRLVGGVLVERTVKDVLPALQTNQDGIKKVIEQLLQSYKKKEEEFGAFQKKYNIQVK
ncbi:Cochaperone prefoldin complex subunit [Basidiobolus ranarum]|uniref:Cochaperone prefoldin complex subunit n=1 Tax=Basidiobolus ranarum TaxID=34480 RepID=A0ABR2X549_9FUNG